jgi:hypothetical protein
MMDGTNNTNPGSLELLTVSVLVFCISMVVVDITMAAGHAPD